MRDARGDYVRFGEAHGRAICRNTGAYGGHASETLAAAIGSPLTAYRCANKKADGYAVYTNLVPAGGFHGYGSSQTIFAIESGPPTEHRSGAEMALLPDGRYHLAVGSTEMGNGSVTAHRQIAAAVLGSRADQIDIINADTDLAPFDTGTSPAPEPSSPQIDLSSCAKNGKRAVVGLFAAAW